MEAPTKLEGYNHTFQSNGRIDRKQLVTLKLEKKSGLSQQHYKSIALQVTPLFLWKATRREDWCR